jgi:predicted enzyme related to lactoylglutathione lyase
LSPAWSNVVAMTNINTNTNTNNTSTDTTDHPASNTGTFSASAVTWFELHTADPERAKAFYGSVFGWSFDDSMPGYTMIQLGDGAPIGGGLVDSGSAYPNDAIFMIQVPDVAAAIDAVRVAGGSVITEAQSMPAGVTVGYVANPDGAVFGIWCPPA